MVALGFHRHNCWWHRDIAGATATPALAQGGVYFEGPGFGVGVGRPAFRADAEQQEALFSDAIGLEVFDTTLQTANTRSSMNQNPDAASR